MKKLILSLGITLVCACSTNTTPASNGPAVPMRIASQINIVTPSNDTNLAATTVENLLRSFNDSGSDYANDIPDFNVRLEALEPLKTANMILCFMSQLGVSDLSTLNSGNYLALVDPTKCEKGESNVPTTGQSSSVGVVSRFRFVVNNSRADAESPQIVRLWLDMDDGRNQEIRGEMIIDASAELAPPFGLFTFNWAQLNAGVEAPDGGGSLVVFNKTPGTGADLTNGNVGLTLYTYETPRFGQLKTSHPNPEDVLGTNSMFVKAASAVMKTDDAGKVTSGLALTQLKVVNAQTGDEVNIDAVLTELNAQSGDFDTEQFSRTFAMSYNNDNLLIQNAHLYGQLPYVLNPDNSGLGTCLSRHQYDEAVWCYNLYDAQSGERVELNSGFPFTIQKQACGSRPMFGYIGYFGIWFEGQNRGQAGCAINDGDIIAKQQRSDAAPEEFEVMRSTGRIVKNTVLQLALTQLRDNVLEMNQLPNETGLFHDPNSNDPNPYAVLASMKESNTFNISSWIVHYLTTSDGVDADGFYIDAFQSNGDGGQTITMLSQLEGVDGLAARYDVTPRVFDGQQIWMYSRQLGGSVRFTKGQSVIIYNKQENVDPTDALFASSDAPADLLCLWGCLKSNITEDNQLNANGTVVGNDTYIVGENDVKYVPYQISRTDMGMKNLSGEDITLAQGAQSVGMYQWGINMAPLVTQSQLGNLTNWWEIWNTVGAVFYTWETGSNSWNTTVSARRAGTNEFVSFDKPIQFSYTHTTQNDRSGSSEHSDETFLLSYQGTCQLSGIPSRKVGRGRDNRYYPEFAIGDGTVLGPDNAYVVKGIHGEQNPMPVNDQCTLMSVGDPAVGIPSQVSGLPGNITVQMPDVTQVRVDNGIVLN